MLNQLIIASIWQEYSNTNMFAQINFKFDRTLAFQEWHYQEFFICTIFDISNKIGYSNPMFEVRKQIYQLQSKKF